MMIASLAAVALMTPAATQVGYDELMDGRDAAAIQTIEGNETLEKSDPARLINLGIAHARQGRTEEARKLFTAAMECEDRMSLETSEGEWKDSRHLARLALKMLDNGSFGSERMAAR
ncbi:hypothetical protein [Erythrobacter sp. HKB08]|uniref:hypothetical protein n=1 Tax=Erythrobacter sp. HKB08 TaxID=2502843 RepID=UPI00100905AA|nr:hypothetical protein [Erythrobacter sp. HKB08]